MSSPSLSTTSSFSSTSTILTLPPPHDIFLSLPNYTKSPWPRDASLRLLYLSTFLLSASFLVPISTPTTPITTISSLLLYATPLSALPSFLPAGYVADYFGRKICIAIGCVITMMAGVLQCVLPGNIAGGVLLGVGVAFTGVSAPALATEAAHPKQRVVATGLFSSAVFFGAAVSSLLSFLGKRHAVDADGVRGILACALPCASLSSLLIMPESPRYLLSKSRKEEALRVLSRFHANNDVDDELVRFEYDEIAECSSSSIPRGYSSGGNARRFIIVVVLGVLTSCCNATPTFSPTTDQTTNSGIILGASSYAAVLSLFFSLLLNKYTRRRLFLLSITGVFISFTLLLVFSAISSHTPRPSTLYATAASSFLLSTFSSLLTPLSFVYILEILPFPLRTKLFSVYYITSTICGIITPVLREKLEWRVYVVYVLLVAVGGAVGYVVLSETRGRTLEEVGVVFDGGKETMAVLEVRYVEATKGRWVVGGKQGF